MRIRKVCGRAAAIIAVSISCLTAAGATERPSPAQAPNYIGSETCGRCHQEELRLWRESQHAHAMAHADAKSVKGSFDSVPRNLGGAEARFRLKDGRYYVDAAGPGGKVGTFEITYTFGVEPLQQYLVEFPDGRLQVLPFAWDTRAASAGGQRWFNLYEGESIAPDDPRYWTNRDQNWNFMCAECHSTGVRKGYDTRNNTFKTTWSEVSVGCETCHGQGSQHAERMKAKEAADTRSIEETYGLLTRYTERHGVTWAFSATASKPVRSRPPAAVRTEVETCGLCHSRRAPLSDQWKPGDWLAQTHEVTLLQPELYYPDGSMRDEVYNYGSFKQSKMFAAGVTCSDCHDPHSGRLRADITTTCQQCHAAGAYATAGHRRHQTEIPCATCHMPIRQYMKVDQRHDHSFRVPSAAPSAAVGAPDVCTSCHEGKSPAWASEAFKRWGVVERPATAYAAAFADAWAGRARAADELAAVAGDTATGDFIRASALYNLRGSTSAKQLPMVLGALSDADPSVRLASLLALDGAPASQLWPVVGAALRDPVRGVRLRAVELLASPVASVPANELQPFEAAVVEYIEAQRLNADRPESRLALGNFFVRLNRLEEAADEFRAAEKLDPLFYPPQIALATLLANSGRRSDAADQLSRILAAKPGDAARQHQVGLAFSRLRMREAAMDSLGKAVSLAPGNPRYSYVYAVALNSYGLPAKAYDVLELAASQNPEDRNILGLLALLARDRGDVQAAKKFAEHVLMLDPDSPQMLALLRSLGR